MAVLAERHGGRLDLVVSAHSLRILMVVLLIPFGFQWVGLHGLDPSTPGPQVVRPIGPVGAGGRLPGRRTVDAALPAVQPLCARSARGGLAADRQWHRVVRVAEAGSPISASCFIGVALGTRFTRVLRPYRAALAVHASRCGTLAMIVAECRLRMACCPAGRPASGYRDDRHLTGRHRRNVPDRQGAATRRAGGHRVPCHPDGRGGLAGRAAVQDRPGA